MNPSIKKYCHNLSHSNGKQQTSRLSRPATLSIDLVPSHSQKLAVISTRTWHCCLSTSSEPICLLTRWVSVKNRTTRLREKEIRDRTWARIISSRSCSGSRCPSSQQRSRWIRAAAMSFRQSLTARHATLARMQELQAVQEAETAAPMATTIHKTRTHSVYSSRTTTLSLPPSLTRSLAQLSAPIPSRRGAGNMSVVSRPRPSSNSSKPVKKLVISARTRQVRSQQVWASSRGLVVARTRRLFRNLGGRLSLSKARVLSYRHSRVYQACQ